jgi:hemerythrin
MFRAIAAHIALEERFMREHRYDQAAQHKAGHERLLDGLRGIMDDHRDREGDSEARLTASIDAWFATHFKTRDARPHSRLGARPH